MLTWVDVCLTVGGATRTAQKGLRPCSLLARPQITEYRHPHVVSLTTPIPSTHSSSLTHLQHHHTHNMSQPLPVKPEDKPEDMPPPPLPLSNSDLLHAYGPKPADESNPSVDKFAQGGPLDEQPESVQVSAYVSASTWAALNLPQDGGELDDEPTQTEKDAMAMACEVDRYLKLYPGASKLPLWGAGYDFKARRKELEKMSVEEREAASADAQEINYDEFKDLQLPSGSTTRPHRVPIPKQEAKDVGENPRGASTSNTSQGDPVDVDTPSASAGRNAAGSGHEDTRLDRLMEDLAMYDDCEDREPFWDA